MPDIKSRCVLFAAILGFITLVVLSVWVVAPTAALVTPAVNSTFNGGALVLTFTGTNNDTITIQSQNTSANDFKVNASAGTTLDGTAGNSETFTGVTSITVNGSNATGESVTFD